MNEQSKKHTHSYDNLYSAVEHGSVDEIQTLINQKADVSELKDGFSPLVYVAFLNRAPKILQTLVDAKANPNLRSDDAPGTSPEMWAEMLQCGKACAGFVCTQLASPLAWATLNASAANVKILIDAKADVNLMNVYRDESSTALFLAVEMGSLDIVKLLVEAKAVLDVFNHEAYTVLDVAERKGHDDIVKLLLDAEAPRGMRSRMQRACVDGRFDEAKLLLDAGYPLHKADLNHLVDNRTPLASAAESGRLEMMKLLLEAKAPVDGGNGIALLCAVAKGDAEAVQILVDAKASLEIRDSHYETPLTLAISCGHAHVVRVLLAAKAALVPASRMDDPLLVASRCGNTDIMKILIDAKVPLDAPLEKVHSLSFSPLLAAVTYQNVPAMQLLVEAKAVTDIPGTEYGYELLSRAIPDGRQSQNENVLRLLLDTHPSWASKQYSSRLLSIAYQRRNFPALQLLLERNASVNGVTVDGLPIFYKAVSDHATSAVKMMIDAKANVNVNGPQLNDTPLILASRQRYRDIVELLLDGNATLDARDRNGYTALHHSITELHSHLRQPPVDESIVQMLVDAKAPLEYNAVRAAFEGRQSAVVKMLMEAKANLRVENIRGVSLLMLALENDLPSILETLLTADPSLLDQRSAKGKTALMIATVRVRPPQSACMVKMLLEQVRAHFAREYNDEPLAKRFKKTG